jgi:hypothetical protein
MLILSLWCYTVYMWTMFTTFRRHMAPPSSGSKCVGWWVSIYIQHWFWKGQGEKGEREWRLMPCGPGCTVDQESCKDVSFRALLVAVCTTFLVHCSYWPRQDTSLHSITSVPPFQNIMLCTHRNLLTYYDFEIGGSMLHQYATEKRGSTIDHCRSRCKGREGLPLIHSFIHQYAPLNLHGHHLIDIYLIPFI